jgi:hypothetical protein
LIHEDSWNTASLQVIANLYFIHQMQQAMGRAQLTPAIMIRRNLIGGLMPKIHHQSINAFVREIPADIPLARFGMKQDRRI